MMHRRFLSLVVLTAGAMLSLLAGPTTALACPFCNAVSQTLRQEMLAMDAVVIASALQSDEMRDKETGQVLMQVEHVLKGGDLCTKGQKVRAIYYGEVEKGRRFLLSGVDPPNLQWSCLPVSKRAEEYVLTVTKLEDDDLARLRFFHKHLQDPESMLARDAYDEFAVAPYSAVKNLGPDMDHDQLVEWIADTEMATDRKRLYLTMLGVCGDEKDLPMLEKLMRSTQKSTRGGLDALIACYLTLAGEKGLPIVNELFLANKKAPYADTYAAIMAIRFHGTEGDVIARSALVESLHFVLERKDLADLVIPDLARWKDWSQIDRLMKLFTDADEDNNWVRVPVVNYLRACPLPEAAAALKKLEQVDPEAVRRAKTFFSIPVPAKDTGVKSSAVTPRVPNGQDQDLSAKPKYVAIPIIASRSGPTAAIAAPALLSANSATQADSGSNLWTVVRVLAMALATIMIMQFLLLTGGPVPESA